MAPPDGDPGSSIEPLVLYGASWCPDCRRSKAFLSEQRIPFHYVDLELQPEEDATVERYNDGKRIIPTIVFPDGSHLAEPSNEELAEKLGLRRDADAASYDLIIVDLRCPREPQDPRSRSIGPWWASRRYRTT
jgi:glutaredoxin